MRSCYFCTKNIKKITYKDVALLKNYLGATGKILSAKQTGNCTTCQRKLKRAVKRARILGLLPFMLR